MSPITLRYRSTRAGLRAGIVYLLVFTVGPALAIDPNDQEPISYSTAEVGDPISKLQQRIDAGELKLQFDQKHGFLTAVLKELGISPSSQMLVFSKTSFQNRLITPERPRAVYFNDDTYVGWVQGGDVVEISTVDPNQGAIFYSLKQRNREKTQFTRHTHECLQCHSSSLTQGVPGHLIRSVYPDHKGFPILSAGTFRTDQTSPMTERWGGWYVTGQHGKQHHMGNAILDENDSPESLDKTAGANVEDLSKLIDTAPYLTKHSDIVALMVLEHQTQMHNHLTVANYESRRAVFHSRVINRMLDRPEDELSPSGKRRIQNASERLVRYMLFVDEAKLTDSIRGTSTFAKDFTAQGPTDSEGRSLRTLDLSRRLFKYPCSYLIYSKSFDALPPLAKEQVYLRLHEILTGSDMSSAFEHLSKEDRDNIRGILLSTKPDLAAFWKQLSLK